MTKDGDSQFTISIVRQAIVARGRESTFSCPLSFLPQFCLLESFVRGLQIEPFSTYVSPFILQMSARM